jgi:cytoskeleton-associated protein 5
MANACEGLDSMAHFLGTALEATSPTQRASLMGWIADYLRENPPSSPLDLSNWASTVVSCLDDRSTDIRKAAQALLPTLITFVGFDKVMAQTNSLKPASRKTAVPIIQAARESTATPPASAPPGPAKPAAKPAPTPGPAAVPSPTPPSSPPPAAAGVQSKLTGVRRKLPQGTAARPDSRAESIEEPSAATRVSGKLGLKRPGAATKAPPSAALTSLPFSSKNKEAKRARLAKDVQKWINEAGPTRKDLADTLQHQMEPHASKELVGQLFSHDHNAVNDHVSGLSTIYEFFSAANSGVDKYGIPAEDMRTIGLACSDLALKYVSIKGHEPQSNLISRCLDVVEVVVSFLRNQDAQIEDSEALCFVPTLIYKVSN